jgi:hypothetical protein
MDGVAVSGRAILSAQRISTRGHGNAERPLAAVRNASPPQQHIAKPSDLINEGHTILKARTDHDVASPDTLETVST